MTRYNIDQISDFTFVHCWDDSSGTDHLVWIARIEPSKKHNRGDAYQAGKILEQSNEIYELVDRISRLNASAGEIGAGMLNTIVNQARDIMEEIEIPDKEERGV